jgi:hypothetical protein
MLSLFKEKFGFEWCSESLEIDLQGLRADLYATTKEVLYGGRV